MKPWENIYVLNAEQRRLFTLANMLPRPLMHRLGRWIEHGRYAGLFDNVEDTLTVRTFQVFDFEAMRDYPGLLEPFVVLRAASRHRRDHASGRARAPEALHHGTRPGGSSNIRSCEPMWKRGLKTWRKKNAAMVLGDAGRRGSDIGRVAAYRRRKLPDDAPSGESSARPQTVRRSLPAERRSARTTRDADTAPPAPA